MALTAYCRKCGREVDPDEVCPYCGTKLGKTAIHAAWVLERRPVADWMCWNSVMRVMLPVGLAVLLLVFLLELLSGGTGALERLFLSGFPVTLLILLCSAVLAVFLVLLLQGKDLMDYVVDSRGVHITRYLPDPTPLKLLLRLRSPAMMNSIDQNSGDAPVLALETREIAWKDVARVQLWPEKCYVLFYSPAWLLRCAVRCTPFTWEDTMDYIMEKLGKKKKVKLPGHLRIQPEKKPSSRAKTPNRVSEAENDELPAHDQAEPELYN